MPPEAIHTSEFALATAEGRSFGAYAACPVAGRGPGLLICTEMWGVTAAKRALAEDYARRGFCAIVPNIFWRCDPPGVIGDTGVDRDLAWARLAQFDFVQAVQDAALAADWLRSAPACSGKVASLGFCMGGRLAVLAAVHGTVDAAVSLYALGVAAGLDGLRRVGCPVQLHYGEADQHVPMSEIDQVSAAAHGRAHIEVWRYPGVEHGFFNPDRASYDAAAVGLATGRIDRLLQTLA